MRCLFFRRSQLVFGAGVFFLFPMANTFAQDVRIETQQQARTRTENVGAQEVSPEAVTDPELGQIVLVSRAPRPKMFTIGTLQTLNYSSNAFLVRDGEQDDLFWNGRVGASFVPFATRTFTPRLTFNQDWFRYDRFSELDFDAQTLQLDLKQDLNREGTWSVMGSYALSRLSSPENGEFYRYGFLNASITRLMQLSTAPVSLGLTAGGYSRHGDPSLSDRVSAYLNLAAIYNIRETIQLSGFTRPEFQYYTHDSAGSREDFNLIVGATLSWNPNPYLSLAATASYIGNFSSISERRYDVVTPSLILAAQFAF